MPSVKWDLELSPQTSAALEVAAEDALRLALHAVPLSLAMGVGTGGLTVPLVVSLAVLSAGLLTSLISWKRVLVMALVLLGVNALTGTVGALEVASLSLVPLAFASRPRPALVGLGICWGASSFATYVGAALMTGEGAKAARPVELVLMAVATVASSMPGRFSTMLRRQGEARPAELSAAEARVGEVLLDCERVLRGRPRSLERTVMARTFTAVRAYARGQLEHWCRLSLEPSPSAHDEEERLAEARAASVRTEDHATRQHFEVLLGALEGRQRHTRALALCRNRLAIRMEALVALLEQTRAVLGAGEPELLLVPAGLLKLLMERLRAHCELGPQ